MHMDESALHKNTHTCHGCGKVDHLKKNCSSKKTGDTNTGKSAKYSGGITFAVGKGRDGNGSRTNRIDLEMAIGEDSGDEKNGWILDSTSICHL